MGTVVREKSALGRELVCRIGREAVEQARREAIAGLKKKVSVPGFRKGRVPDSIISQRFAEDIREHILHRLIPEAYACALKEHNLRPAVEPEVTEVAFDDDGLSCTIYTELRPDVTVGKYVGLTLKRMEPKAVTDEQVEAVLADWERRPEFVASVIDPEKRRAWRARIREQLEEIARAEARSMEENQLWEQLLAGATFPVPEKMVADRAAGWAREELRRRDLSSVSEEDVRKMAQELIEKAKPAAEREIRKYFILDHIASAEKIEASEEEVERRVERLARLAGEPLEDVRRKLQESGRLDDIREDIRIEKAFAFIKENAQIIERVVLPGEESRARASDLGRRSRGGA